MSNDEVFDALKADARLREVSRHAAEAERRAEAELLEQQANVFALRNRDLAAVMAELVHRGDHVAVHAGGWVFRGVVVYAVGDLATVSCVAGQVDVNLAGDVAVEVVERMPAGGTGRPDVARSFRSRLAMHEQSGATVELGSATLDDELRVRITAVARDHVLAVDSVDGREWILPISTIVYAMAG